MTKFNCFKKETSENKSFIIKNDFNNADKLCFLIFPVAVILMEIILKICTVSSFFDLGLLFMALFSISCGTLLGIICSCFEERVNNILARIFLFSLAVIYSTQTVYHWCFDKYLILYSVGVGGADQIIEDGLFEQTLKTIKACALPIIFYFAVAVLFSFLIGKRGISFKKRRLKYRIISAVSNLGYHFLILVLVLVIPHSREIYLQAFDPNLTVGLFGLMHTETTDFIYNVLNLDSSYKLDTESSSSFSASQTPSQPSSEDTPSLNQNEPWVMDIDFDSLIANETDPEKAELHKYFSTRKPTYKNEYTGKYKDYNLIYITAEGFSEYAIDKELTPTLYKMYNGGYKFTNFYNPIWGVSTSDGEYVNCTGLIPKSGVWSFFRSGEQKNNMAFTMGRQFLKQGVKNIYAYHNHTYSYYHRDISHPNMGYIYKGVGNGLENKITKSWPESDLEMIEATADEYISNKQFHAYYMSVSGHLDYSFESNAMASKNKAAVDHLNEPEKIKAYLACHIELDKAMESLLNKLEAAGVADKTLIVIAPDHYPYGLEDKENKNKYHYFDRLAGHTVETNFELYKSALIMYSPSMSQGIQVDKYCSSLDIVPTLSNLFGFEYDSRLLMGRDIFSNSSPLVVFSNRSFITDKGMYNSVTRTFTPFEGVVLNDEENYLTATKTEVNNMFVASAGILDNDYYGILFGNSN